MVPESGMDLSWLEAWWIWSAVAIVLGTVFWARRQKKVYRRLAKSDDARLARLRARWETAPTPGERRAIEILLAHVDSLQARWFLDAGQLNGWEVSRTMVSGMAAAYHPDSEDPLTRARIGPLLTGFLVLKNTLLDLTRMPGMGGLMKLRLRHIESLQQAWQKKKVWDNSSLGKFARRWNVFFIIKWGTNLARCGDALFWLFKSGGFVLYDIAFKRMLVRWYLALGEVALEVYGGPERKPQLADDDVLEDLDELEEPQAELADFPPQVRALVEKSRKELMLATKTLTWKEIEQIDRRLVKDIAANYYPEAEQPLKEATLLDCLLSLSRLCESLSSLKNRKVISKVLDLRLSHLLKIKKAADSVLDSQWFEYLKKYKVGEAVKYSTLAYKTFKRGNPGVLFKDIAYTVAREGGKRWLALYIHGKVAREADRVYSLPPVSKT